MTLKFEFSDKSLLDLSLKLNFYDTDKKMISGIGLTIDKSGYISLPPKYVDLISYFPYPLLIKSGNSNIASVLLDSAKTLKRCRDYTTQPEPYNILCFYIDRETGIVKTAFMAEKETYSTKEAAVAATSETAIKEVADTKMPAGNTEAQIIPLFLNGSSSGTNLLSAERYLKGKIASSDGHPLKNMSFVVYVQELTERASKDIKMIPLLSSKSDNLGVFSVKVPNKVFAAAYATIGAATDKPVPIHLEEGKLPSFTLLLADKTAAPADATEAAEDDCDCHKAPPARLPEMEDLLSENSSYQQDIGGSCVNFTTPNRALEEFSYYSVVRLTDPEVMNAPGYVENLRVRIAQLEKSIADLKVRNLKEDKINGVGTSQPTIPNILIPELQRIIQNVATYKTASELELAFTSAINKAIQGGEPIAPDITKIRPAGSFPQLFAFPTSKNTLVTATFTGYINTQNTFRTQLLADRSRAADKFNGTASAVTPVQESLLQNVGWMEMELSKLKAELALASSRTGSGKMRQKVSMTNQIQWDAPMPIVQPASIAHGHLLSFRQVWRADGYSMGDLLYSMPLAPGQQKQIAIHDWDRKDTASRSEIQSVEESLSNTLSQDRDINEIIKSSLREDIEAESKARTSGISMGAGSALGASATIPVGGIPISAKVGFSGGFSMGSGKSSSSASQQSSRDLSGSTMQNIREKTMQTASALRSQRSTVITSISQSETTTVTTESIANYNHCHAITIQYFEVLRHLAVYNELTDVQECLFIPLTMSLFDDSKIVRWNDLLKPALRAPIHRFDRLLKAFDSVRRYYEINALGRPASEVYYNMPSGRYCDEKIRELSGSMRIKISFTCPKKAMKTLDERTADSIAKLVGAGIATALTGIPVDKLGGILGGLGSGHRDMINDLLTDQESDRKNWKDQLGFIAEVENIRIKVNRTPDEKREEVFQAELQRVNAIAQFAKHLKIVVGTPAIQPIHARVALTRKGNAKNAKINGEAPAYDFSFRTVSGRFSRERDEIVSFGISCDYTNALPEGSILIVEHIQAGYQSDYLTAGLCNDRPSDDLLAGPVMINTPMTEAEMVSPRAEDLRLRNELLDHLNSNMEYYHKSIWMQMDADRRLLLLEGFEIDIPARENPAYAAGNGEPQYLFPARTVSVASVVENRLVGIAGNSLIMPVAKGFNLNPIFRFANDEVEVDGRKISRLMSYYMPERGFKDTPFRISIPTKGVFAESVMGACNSCEKIDNTRYWKWEEHPIPNSPAAINPVGADSRYQTNNLLTPGEMAASLLKIQDGKSLPDPTGLGKAFDNLTKSDIFKDMTGLEGNQKNAIEALKSQTEAAREYAKNAADLAKSMEIPKSADGVADSIKRNVKNPEKQQALIEKYFDNMLSGGSNAKGGGTEGGETDEGSGGQSDPIRRAAGKALDKMGDGGKGRMKTEFPDGTKLEMESEGSTASTQEEEFLDIEDELSAELQDFENRFVNQTPGTGTGTSSTTPNNQ